jgi:hypothetical protein
MNNTIWIGLYPGLQKEDLEYSIKILKKIYLLFFYVII